LSGYISNGAIRPRSTHKDWAGLGAKGIPLPGIEPSPFKKTTRKTKLLQAGEMPKHE